jgi:hypothetical protein
MRISNFLVIKKNGWRYTSRLTAKAPALASSEIAVKISLEIPDAVFEKPAFEANITIPKEAISKPVIETEVIDNVQALIKQNLGFEVKLQLVEPKEDDTK